ncbi:hypothetical protein KAI37_02944 [Paenibacillus sp. S25]|nr:hypothetical protein KAI37_02944 [Paenibacillus sp. S25]
MHPLYQRRDNVTNKSDFEFVLYYKGKRVKIMFFKSSLLRALKEARSLLDPKKYDCVEIYRDDLFNRTWIKEYSL